MKNNYVKSIRNSECLDSSIGAKVFTNHWFEQSHSHLLPCKFNLSNVSHLLNKLLFKYLKAL